MTIHQPATQRTYRPSVVAALRQLSPKRPLQFAESLQIAERQAQALLSHAGCTQAPVGEELIATLPWLAIERSAKLIGSGMSSWSQGTWRLLVNDSEPLARQRFTIAHELKHIIDAADEDVIYRHLPAGPARDRHIEAVCDHFAACLLMPRTWLKHHWADGLQDISTLAWHFQVSQQAMRIRLQAIGLIEPRPHSGAVHSLGRVAVRSANAARHTSTRHHRRMSTARDRSLSVEVTGVSA